MTTTEPAVDPVEANAGDANAVGTDPGEHTDPVQADPVEITDPVSAEPPEPELCWLNLGDLAPHPDNPRRSLGDLTEGSGFHLMRAIRTVVIWGGRPGDSRRLMGVGEVGATSVRQGDPHPV